jgi:hypothetical protein
LMVTDETLNNHRVTGIEYRYVVSAKPGSSLVHCPFLAGLSPLASASSSKMYFSPTLCFHTNASRDSDKHRCSY